VSKVKSLLAGPEAIERSESVSMKVSAAEEILPVDNSGCVVLCRKLNGFESYPVVQTADTKTEEPAEAFSVADVSSDEIKDFDE